MGAERAGEVRVGVVVSFFVEAVSDFGESLLGVGVVRLLLVELLILSAVEARLPPPSLLLLVAGGGYSYYHIHDQCSLYCDKHRNEKKKTDALQSRKNNLQLIQV